MMLCITIYYKYSAVSDNKYELIQVVVAANVTTYKSFLNPIMISIIQIEKSLDGVLGIRTLRAT